MAILTNSGRVAMAKAILAQPIHMAWGSGDSAWDANPEPESVLDSALLNEVGRRLVSQAKYCAPDEASGEIFVPTGRFTESLTPTRHIYLRFSFDFTDAPAATIREVAVFSGTETDSELPPGQMYFEPGDVVDPGTLLVIERVQKFERSPSVRQSFEFVVTF